MSLHRAQVALDVPDSNCLKHGNKSVLYFCKTCNEGGCSKCMQTKHRHHEWCDIEDISEDKQKELESNINILENEKLPKLKEKRATSQGQKGADEGEVNQQADAMITLINKHRHALLSKINSTTSSGTEAATNMADVDRDIADVEQIIRNSKKSIAIQAKSEIVQGNENVKVVIAEVDKSLAEMGRSTVTCFRCGEIDTRMLQRMLGDVESEYDMSSDFEQMNISQNSSDVSIKVINTMTVGKGVIRICPVDKHVWQNGSGSENICLMNIDGKILHALSVQTIQDLSRDKSGNVYMCSFQNKWISRMTPEHRVVDIVNTSPLHPYSLCVTQSGDILVALVEVRYKDIDKYKQTYIARLDSLGREKQMIQFEEDGKTRLFQYACYVNENKNGDIVVLDRIGEYKGRLYILNNKGEVKHSYNGTSKLEEFDFLPVSVCCDDQSRITVADLANSALHLLNARGELLQLLMTEKDGLVHPHSLGLCDGMLWIGTWEGKVIVAEYNT